MPSVYFFHVEPWRDESSVEEEDEEESNRGDEESLCSRIWRTFRYTSLSAAVLGFLLLLAFFVPSDDGLPLGRHVVVFLLNVLNLIGMSFLVVYTGYGLSSLPWGMIRGSRNVHTRRESIVNQMEVLQAQIQEIKERNSDRNIPYYEQQQMERLEQQVRLLQRSDRVLEQNARSCINRCILILRPFQLFFGIFFSVCGFLIFSSLFMSCLDKALHSSMSSGYVLIKNTLPNPADFILVYAQDMFPLDYIIYTGIILFFVFCSMSGVRHIGIRFLWIPLYKIRANKTRPQGLILMCLLLIYIIMALNVVMYSIVPDYSTYGSQRYVYNNTADNTTVVKKCADRTDNINDTQCVMSQISILLTDYHEKAWIFGALYFWLNWILLGVIVVGSLVSVFCIRRTSNRGDEGELLDSDDDEENDEELGPDNPFSMD